MVKKRLYLLLWLYILLYPQLAHCQTISSHELTSQEGENSLNTAVRGTSAVTPVPPLITSVSPQDVVLKSPGVAVELPVDVQSEQEKLRLVLKKLAREPPIEMLIDAALRLAHADAAPGKRWQTNVRLSPILPTLKFSVGYDMEHDESLKRYQDEPDRWGADTDSDFGAQLTVQWELDALVFNPDELKVYGSLANRAQRRGAVISQIVAFYFERRRLQILSAARPETDLEKRIQQIVRINELTALIDALTGGALTLNL